jgi:endonuclease-8
MAEGDTIVRTGRRLEPMVGETVAASAPNPRGRAAGVERLDGLVLESVETRGKNLLLVFEGGLALHSHLGMNGSWRVYPAGEPWGRSPRSAWALLRGEHHEAAQFGGPTLRVLPTAAGRRELARLGPDILAAELDLGDTVASLASAPERSLGDALLDQGLIAGIGNIFKSEACFAARLDPWQAVGDREREQLGSVLEAARELMQRSVARGRPDRSVYKRSGMPCPRCGTQIRSRGQGDANRTTYWCPNCQTG